MNGTTPIIPATPIKKNGLAIASMVVGIVSVIPILSLGFIWGVVEGIVAAVLGFVALSQIKKRGESGKGMAVTGIILGLLSVAYFVVVILILVPIIGDAFSSIESSLGGY